ncbi:bifunctional 3-(3-hydroxy-phenyl)propionate/3-hydroxycinnamic acid hydroxylase [Catenulispora yoronensis]|uniref:Bifunctional 3-(3-hydroxy-phenyl)propionate/3-hydroxycinnamic acid hydroxylase n=1 Tax=Catenulispora yoronensis TaxID=450799 RepID=A0ABN2TJS5_9ACTN
MNTSPHPAAEPGMAGPADPADSADSARVADVAIVGYGPVGQLLAALLGRHGYEVVVIERYGGIYPMPRAVHFDHEVARILQSVGIRPDTDPIIEPYDDWYEWRNANRQTLLRVDWRGVGPSWWNTANFFAQPDLERELDARARKHPTVTVRRGLRAVAVDQDRDGVTVTVRPTGDSGAEGEPHTVRARYLVGCDGANSTVRNLLGLELTDLGFFFDWLILDMIPNEPMTFDPPAWQLCDPARPTTIVPGGPGRRRWEFMALPGEDVNDLNKAETAWELLRPWGLTPDNAELERHTVYRFQAHWADEWRAGRVLIAGDAAHLMPPFAGQGMCAGLRDVFNLAWKLDLVLRGAADDRLLDTYGPERSPHVRHFIDVSIGLGKVICVPGQEQAAERDRELMAAIADPALAPAPPPAPRLGPGVFADGDEQAGLLSIQSRVEYDGCTGLFDDVVGHGWFVLIDAHPGPRAAGAVALTAASRAVLARLGAKVLRVGAPDSPDAEVVDLDGRYAGWFADLGAEAVVIRPDFYVHAATDAAGLDGTLRALGARLAAPAPDRK